MSPFTGLMTRKKRTAATITKLMQCDRQDSLGASDQLLGGVNVESGLGHS